jgi:hypothetical protein
LIESERLKESSHVINEHKCGGKSLSLYPNDNDAGKNSDPTFESRGFPVGDASPRGFCVRKRTVTLMLGKKGLTPFPDN